MSAVYPGPSARDGITIRRRELTYSRRRTYRVDTSSRYIGSICSSEPQARGDVLRARPGRAGAAQGDTDVWLRAEEAALGQARRLLASQLRLPVPVPQAAGRRRRPRRRGLAVHLTQEACLPVDRPGQPAVPPAPRDGRRPRAGAGPVLHATGLLPLPAAGGPPLPARAAARLPPGAAGRPARLGADSPRAHGRLHHRADGPRAGRTRARNRMARPSDRPRAALHRERRRAGPGWAPGSASPVPARPPPARTDRVGRAIQEETRHRWESYASRSSAWATARRRWCRACTSTPTPSPATTSQV